MSSGTETTKVLIIGAGMSGTQAAKIFHENGMTDFIILEASTRMGGRMLKTEFAGVTVEKGAGWIHGIEENPIWELAQKYNISGQKTTYNSYVAVDDNGNNVTSDVIKAHYDFELAKDVMNDILIDKYDTDGPDITLRTGLQLGGWQPDTPAEQILEYFAYDFDNAEKADITSFLNYLVIENRSSTFEEEDYFITDSRGYEHIVQREMQSILQPDDTRLRFREEVVEIRYDDTSVTVLTSFNNTYQGDYAVLTVSIGVLQKGSVRFVPPLPYWKKELFHKMRMRTYTKIFLHFPYKFWGDTEMTLLASERRGYWPVWDNSEYAGRQPAGTNIFMCTVTGQEADRIRRMTPAQVRNEAMQVLRQMYGPSIPEADDILIPDWHSDPLTYGSYSSWPLGFSELDHLLMGQALGSLHFAGEAYADDWATVTGAYESGRETAWEILDLINNDK